MRTSARTFKGFSCVVTRRTIYSKQPCDRTTNRGLRCCTFFLGEALSPSRRRLCTGVETPAAPVFIARTHHLQKECTVCGEHTKATVDRNNNGRGAFCFEAFSSSGRRLPPLPLRHTQGLIDKNVSIKETILFIQPVLWPPFARGCLPTSSSTSLPPSSPPPPAS